MFLGNYKWDSKNPKVHGATAEREHQDLSIALRRDDNHKIQAIPETDAPSIELNGDVETWKIPCKKGNASSDDSGTTGITVDGVTYKGQQVQVCVAGVTKTMLILGSDPY